MPEQYVEDRKRPMTLDLQFFAEGDDDPEGGGGNPDNPDGGEGGGSDDNPGGEETFSKEYVEKLRKEAAKYRTKAKDTETQSQQEQQEMMKKVLEAFGVNPDPDKAMDEQLQQAQTKAQEAEQKANDRLMRAEVKAQAAEMDIESADAAYKLMDTSELSINDDGEVEGLEEALKATVEKYPFLKKDDVPSSGGGDFSGGKPPADLDAQIKDAEEKGDISLSIALQRQKSFGQKQ